MTHAVEPVGDEMMNDIITLMPKCLQSVLPNFKNTHSSTAPDFFSVTRKLYRGK